MKLKQLGRLGQEIFEARYAYPGEKTWGERAKVIAKTAASCEQDEIKQSVFDKFYDVLGAADNVPGGRIVFGAGRDRQNLLNCFAITPQDNVTSIGKLLQDVYRISCGGGGIGFNFSQIRPRGDNISNISNSAPGSVSVMRMVNGVADHVKAGKNRRSALIAILNVTHPDLLEFLSVKLDRKELNNFNISVGITNRFLEAVENDEDWYFFFNNKKYYNYELIGQSADGAESYIVNVPALSEEDARARALNFHKRKWDDTFTPAVKVPLKAKAIWDNILKHAVDCGEPGFFNIDLVNSHTNIYWTKMEQTNPCGEIPLESYGNCCLGQINLSNMILEDGSDIDWKRFANAVRTGIRFLDNILTVNHYPIEETKEVANHSRRIGLGVIGYHYALIKLGLVYGTDKAIEFTERLLETYRNEAYLTSIYLAREKGSFPKFDAKQFLNTDYAKLLPARIRMLIKEHGIRNAVMLSIAPTGTIGMLMETSTGLEPIFSWAYKRRYRDGNVWKEQVVVDPLFKEYYLRGKDTSVFVGAYDITPEQHLRTQVCFQRYIDNSISKTINLPKEANWQDLSNVTLNALHYLKGLTFYRAGSRGNEPLEAIPLTKENIAKYMSDEDYELAVGEVACAIGDNSCGA
jgi:ribonucleoside-diphosphate reductase alpha chain